MTIHTLTKTGLTVSGMVWSTSLAQAHTALVEHAHPHEAAHAYASLQTIALATIGTIIGVTAFVLARKLARELLWRRS